MCLDVFGENRMKNWGCTVAINMSDLALKNGDLAIFSVAMKYVI